VEPNYHKRGLILTAPGEEGQVDYGSGPMVRDPQSGKYRRTRFEMGVHEYRFVRRYLERCPQAPLSLRQVDPLIRELVHYRDLIHIKTKEQSE